MKKNPQDRYINFGDFCCSLSGFVMVLVTIGFALFLKEATALIENEIIRMVIVIASPLVLFALTGFSTVHGHNKIMHMNIEDRMKEQTGEFNDY